MAGLDGRLRAATLFVVASNAKDITGADYVCDGTADDVQIQAAIDAVALTGGVVQLSEGLFSISTRIVPKADVWLRGAGGGVLSFENALCQICGRLNCDPR